MLRYMIKSRNGLSANGGVPTSSDRHDYVFQLLIMVFIVSVKWRMEWNITRFQESVAFCGTAKSFSLTRRLKIDIQGRTSVSCNGVNGQYVHLYGFNTVWEPMIWFQQGILQTRSMGKLGQLPYCRRPPQMWEIYYQMCTTKMGFNLDQADIWFNP